MGNADHRKKVERIAERVLLAEKEHKKIKIYHGSSNSTRNLNYKSKHTVDISDLDQILGLDTKNHTILVEPNVSMEKLVDFTLKHKLIPKVVMEFPGITVGGGISGISGESSSFKYGGFHETVTEYEVVIGNGSVVRATHVKNSDLFYGLPGSYGSLGIITSVKLQLVPAKKYVQVTYKKLHRLRD